MQKRTRKTPRKLKRNPYDMPVEGDVFYFESTQTEVKILAIRQGWVWLKEFHRHPYQLQMADFRRAFDHLSCTHLRTDKLKKSRCT